MGSFRAHGKSLVRLMSAGIVIGLTAGSVGGFFARCVRDAAILREAFPWLILLLPLVPVVIVFLYRLMNDDEDPGTNLVITALNHDDHLPLRRIPEIFIASTLSHLSGASVGRAGASLQIGASIGDNLGEIFQFAPSERKILTMCGMSATFSAVFGTPLAAAFFALEISSVGVTQYAAFLPCAIAALVGSRIALFIGATPDVFPVTVAPVPEAQNLVYAAVIAVLSALLATVFCFFLKGYATLYRSLFSSAYRRGYFGGAVLLALTLLSGSRFYNGGGMDIIPLAMDGTVPYPAFLMKLLFTSLSVGAGFKGGEIGPALSIGACFGAACAAFSGVDPAFSAAVAMSAFLCGITNCPMTALLFSIELFGAAGMPFYLLAVAVSFAFSGYGSLYSAQEFPFSKFRYDEDRVKPADAAQEAQSQNEEAVEENEPADGTGEQEAGKAEEAASPAEGNRP